MFCLLREGGKAQRQTLNISCNTLSLLFFFLSCVRVDVLALLNTNLPLANSFFSCSVCFAFMLLKPTETLCCRTGTVANNSFRSKGNSVFLPNFPFPALQANPGVWLALGVPSHPGAGEGGSPSPCRVLALVPLSLQGKHV